MRKEVERMERLRKLFVSRSRKYADMIDHPAGLDEMSLRRSSAHRMWVHLIIIRRMYARSIETLYDYVWHALRKIERARMIWEPDDFKQEEYEAWTKILLELGELRRQNGNWLVDIKYHLQKFRISLSETEWFEFDTSFTLNRISWEGCNNESKYIKN